MRTCFFVFLCIYLLFCYEKVFGENSVKSIIFNDCKASKIDLLVFDYICKADAFFFKYDIDSMKLSLDAAFYHVDDVLNSAVLGSLYSYYGIYFSTKQLDNQAHLYYYKAIEYYEKAEKLEFLIPIYNNLAFSYLQKHDTESLKKIIDKMRLIAFKRKDISDYINTYCVLSFYFNCLYEKDKEQSLFLDSAIYYDREVISIYENTEGLSVRDEDIAYNYLNLASNLLEKEPMDRDLIKSYLKKSEDLMNKEDSTMLYNQYWVKGRIAYKQQKYSEAEQLFNTQLTIMDQWLQGAPLSMYAEVFEMLAKVSEVQKKYVEALEYERRRIGYLNQIHDVQKYEKVRELETRYEVEKKEQAIVQLTELNKFRQKISYLYLGLFILGVVACVFVIHWSRQKRKAANAQLELSRLEKHDAMLQVQLKEEQLKKTQLEKYEALLDSHFKKEQLSEMDEVLSGLKEEQEQLNRRIDEYAEKVKAYENRKPEESLFATVNPNNTSLVRDIYELVNKRLGDEPEQEEYLERLRRTEDWFFAALRAKSADELSPLNVKYCVCFFIDMKTEHIATCMSVESGTVLITRHRLKTKLRIGRGVDITTFLKQMGNE